MSTIEFTAKGITQPTRLDKLLRQRFPEWGRSAVKSLVNQRQVLVNGKVVWLGSWLVNPGDRITILRTPAAKPEAPEVFLDEWIIADQGDIIAVNKPAGLRAQAGFKGDQAHLLYLAQVRFGEVALFHRLDRDTSGVTLLTRPGPVNTYLDQTFQQHLVEKHYLAWVQPERTLPRQGTIDARIGPHPRRKDMMQVVEKGGKTALTHYRVLQQKSGRLLLELQPITGRTHQLRLHLAHLGTPIIGDRLYGGLPAARLMLHAASITLPEDKQIPTRSFNAEVEWGNMP